MKKWNVAVPDPEAVRELQKNSELSKLCCTVLAAQGYADLNSAAEFMGCQDLSSPFAICDMREAAEIFKGEHNFENFTSKEEDEQKFWRNIEVFDIKCENSSIEITISGNGFMRYMVRMLVGSIVQVGLGKMSTKDLQYELEIKIRKPSSHKAPAYGLYLKEVNYKN